MIRDRLRPCSLFGVRCSVLVLSLPATATLTLQFPLPPPASFVKNNGGSSSGNPLWQGFALTATTAGLTAAVPAIAEPFGNAVPAVRDHVVDLVYQLAARVGVDRAAMTAAVPLPPAALFLLAMSCGLALVALVVPIGLAPGEGYICHIHIHSHNHLT